MKIMFSEFHKKMNKERKMRENKEKVFTDSKAMEHHLETIFNNNPLFATKNYTIYDNGDIGHKLIGLTKNDIILDLVTKLQQAQQEVEIYQKQEEIFKKIVRNFAFDIEKEDWLGEFASGSNNFTKKLQSENAHMREALRSALILLNEYRAKMINIDQEKVGELIKMFINELDKP